MANASPERQISGSKEAARAPAFSYPGDLQSSNLPYLAITAKEFTTTLDGFKAATPLSFFYLPLPGSLVIPYSVQYGDQELGIYGQNGGFMANVKRLGAGLADNAGTVGGAGTNTNATGAYRQATGSLPNPNTLLQYAGPSFREISFQFDFIMRNAQETQNFLSMMAALKAYQYPEDGATLSFPENFKVEVLPDANGYFRMPRAALSDLQVTLNPSGVPTYFQGTKGVFQYQVSMTFKEMNFLTKKSFTDDIDPAI